jgi:hypothetical protein
MYKPSLIKTNARYRGPTELEKFINMIHEVVHDLRFLCYKIDTNDNDISYVGHKDAIESNMYYYIAGQTYKPMIKVPTATTLCNSESSVTRNFQSLSSISSENKSIKSRISVLDAEIKFLLNNL